MIPDDVAASIADVIAATVADPDTPMLERFLGDYDDSELALVVTLAVGLAAKAIEYVSDLSGQDPRFVARRFATEIGKREASIVQDAEPPNPPRADT